MLCPVFDGALAGHDGLYEEAKHREHCKTAVLDLLHLELGEGVGVVCEAKGVKALTCMIADGVRQQRIGFKY